MFCSYYRNQLLGAFRPGRTVTLESAASHVDERATLIHEGIHVFLTENTTTGFAAQICGLKQAAHDLTVLPDESGMRSKLSLPYLKFYQSAASWDQEGAATACEAIHWSEITGQPREQRLSQRPPDYVEAAAEYINFLSPSIKEFTNSIDPHICTFIFSSLVSSVSLAVFSSSVPPDFYRAAIDGTLDGFQEALADIPRRRHRIFSIPKSELIGILSLHLTHLIGLIDHSLDDLEAKLESRLPGENNRANRKLFADGIAVPHTRSRLIITLLGDELVAFREHVATAILQHVDLSFGVPDAEVAAEFGYKVSPRSAKLLWTNDGVRAEVRRPVEWSPAVEPLDFYLAEWARIASCIVDYGMIAIPEITGPFIDEHALFFLHMFKYDGSYHGTIASPATPPEFEFLRLLIGRLTYVLAHHKLSPSRCLGVVCPYGINETQLNQAVADLPVVLIPHLGVHGSAIESETLIGIQDGNGLVRQFWADGQITWQTIRANYPDLPSMNNLIDRCYSWVLANGGNANAIWLHNTGYWA